MSEPTSRRDATRAPAGRSPRTARLALLAAGVAAALPLASPPSAVAGSYRAAQCNERLGAGHADAVFQRTVKRYRSDADCASTGLRVTHDADGWLTRAGRSGAWRLIAPAGTTILRAATRVAAATQHGHAPQLFVTAAGGARRFVADVRGSLHPVSWEGEDGRSLTARLTCVKRPHCGPGRRSHIRIRRIVLMLRDAVAPTLELGGELLEAGSRRGTDSLIVATGDAGSGVRSAVVEVNGDPLATRTLGCRLSGVIATRLRPCPSDPRPEFAVATAAGQFRQGPNAVRVCVADYAATTNANRTCAGHGVRVDNRCPLSGVAGAVLRARFRGGSTTLRTRSDRSARIVGRLTDAAGAAVAGARVCVAARALVPGTSERVLATPYTAADGSFRARIPAGPSREIRIAHWPDEYGALERFLKLRTRVVPRLRLRPRRPLRNGERVRFRVRIPAPRAGGRRIAVEARAGGRWVRIARGRSGARGAWRGAYRFRSTSGRRRYAFRAVVPRQAGYPYERGSSRPRRAIVVGP